MIGYRFSKNNVVQKNLPDENIFSTEDFKYILAEIEAENVDEIEKLHRQGFVFLDRIAIVNVDLQKSYSLRKSRLKSVPGLSFIENSGGGVSIMKFSSSRIKFSTKTEDFISRTNLTPKKLVSSSILILTQFVRKITLQ